MTFTWERVRAECKAQHGGLFNEPCITICAEDMKTVVETFDCVVWCPRLNRRLDDEEDVDGRDSR